jgi:ATP-dependent Clp protease adapter protein ClpS
MIANLVHRIRYLFNRARFFYVPLPPVGVVVLYQHPGPTDAGIEIVNDDQTHMEFVVRVLERCFTMRRRDAIISMVKIHTEGHALIGYTEQAIAEQLISHVTRVARGRGFPLECRLVTAA